MQLYENEKPRIGYDPMRTSKVKHWIYKHYQYLNKRKKVLRSYCDYGKYNMTIYSFTKGFVIVSRFHDSVSKCRFDFDSIGSRLWTKNHSIRKPIVKMYRRKNKNIICPCVKVLRLKYKLGSRFEVVRKTK